MKILQRCASERLSAPTAIIVMGVSGCGKSTVGALLADALGCAFLEGDSFHEADAIAKMRSGVPLSDEDRWPWLDRIGNAAGRELVHGQRIVIACSALRRIYRERLIAAIPASTGFLLLGNSREEILRRLKARSHAYMPAALLDSQLATLEPPEADEPAMILESNVGPDILCRQALEWVAGNSLHMGQGSKRLRPSQRCHRIASEAPSGS